MNAGFGGWATHHADSFARALACARIGLGALAANGQAAQVPDPAIAFDALQALEVHADFPAQIAFDDVLAVLNRVDNLRELLFGQILGANAWVNIGFGKDVAGIGGTNAVNVAQSDVDALIRRNFNADDTSHNVCIRGLTVRG